MDATGINRQAGRQEKEIPHQGKIPMPSSLPGKPALHFIIPTEIWGVKMPAWTLSENRAKMVAFIIM
jgi:hypothetical protein